MMIDREKSGLLLIDMQEKLVPLVAEHRDCIAHCQWMLGIAQTLNIPIFTTQQYPQRLGATVKPLQTLIDTQRIINKIAFSVMQEPEGAAVIKASGKTQWVLIGIETHVCLLQSALGLKEAGHDVFVVHEATQARSPHDKTIAIERLRHAGVQIITREMAVFEWLRVAGTAEFKRINEGFIK